MTKRREGRQRKCKLTPDEIITLYKEGKSTQEIGDIANVSRRHISQILTNNNVEKRPRGSWKRKYTLNEDYFKTWSNNMAYILGFIVADGTVYRDGQTVSIAQKEKYILENIKKELGSNQPLYRNEQTGVYMLNLNSKKIKTDLSEKHGIKPNKSTTIDFPYIPEEYLSHFVRGFFDGDGFIYYGKNFASFVGGSLSFMMSLKQNLEVLGFEPNFNDNGSYYRIFISGRKTIKLFANWMYKDKGLYLTRKFSRFPKDELEPGQLHDREYKISKRKLKLIELYNVTENMEYVLKKIRISTNIYNKWLSTDPDFKRKIIEIESKNRL
ncbi:intein-encoded DNA endonuclease-like protein [Salirhabdus euzebyi]|uniref:Intein-encoded DNA endonuclease-like protein n=1 Tax=Salirhabdus euzebyi TaxID=394506 RepID=A0A841PYK8_9BACI|nr:LAGLIDADG family homing endonuclease [Salirhabdus euzebyi]MBB6452776.1 intein-encoded DNA endonuclease-like protein [Salirhabdus euzebyi]